MPSTIESSHILVITNNTGYTSDDFSVHDQAAQSLVNWKKFLAKFLGCPLLVPVFPRPYDYNEAGYTHALDEVSLTDTSVVYHRLDLQLIAMIEDAINRLDERGIDFEETILMWGFSASGMFANRFTALHPERVKAAAIGAPGGWPIAEEIYNSVDCNCEFVLYPGIGHEITIQTEGDVKTFLLQYRRFK